MPRWRRRDKSRSDQDTITTRNNFAALAESFQGSPAPKAASTAVASLRAVSGGSPDSTRTTTSPTNQNLPDSVTAQKLAKQHAEFGPLGDPSHLYTSEHPGGEIPDPILDEPPYFIALTTYISFLVLIFLGHFHDAVAKWFRSHTYRHLRPRNGYASLYSDFESFYTRRLKQRINDCFERPTTGVPGRYITLLDRQSYDDNLNFQLTGTTTDTLNLSSYNYLGFAQSEGPCSDNAEEVIRQDGISMSGSCGDASTSKLHVEVENQVARFVGKEDAVIFSMGFVTNATIFPAIVGKGCLILSDELNHASIRFGARLSGASIQVFAHNNMADLEKRLREAISQGQPRTHRPWKKILVTVEGLFSMEGTMCNLPRILELKKRYKFHLFIDEAHSIGAVGPRGRGVCDYFKIDPAEVDILMGTFTKSFGANGGYVAGDKAIIDKIRCTNAGQIFGEAPAPSVLAQISSSFRLIADEDPLHPGQGRERVQRLAFNSRYLRLGLKRLGFIVYGHDDSPIVPLMLYNPAKMSAFSHEMLKRKISVVVVTYPATPLELSRVRFCLSAAHTKDDLDRLLMVCDEVGNALRLKYSTGIAGGLREPLSADSEKGGRKAIEPPRWTLEEAIERGTQDAKLPLY
ncbi:serine palmitoyltransferase component [Aspergillus melleus]|uniref:Serine palmitoyltransferase component n=1 Tax=Aspergillus melleus TaxID=138277 RepID=A0ACC3ATE1_9EURO|nr:serine palmitoyltransferase component [Aspergillus melleus]